MTQGSVDAAVVAAINSLHFKRHVVVDGREVEVVLLVHPDGWRPLLADWWTGKQASLIGADTSGNFLLRLADGSVAYWVHAEATAKAVSPSVRDFVASLR